MTDSQSCGGEERCGQGQALGIGTQDRLDGAECKEERIVEALTFPCCVIPRSRKSREVETRARRADRFVGVRLRHSRVIRGMSLSKLAANIGLSYQQVQKYEKGENSISVGRLVVIAAVLKIDPARLLTNISCGEDMADQNCMTAAPLVDSWLQPSSDGLRLAAAFDQIGTRAVRSAVLSMVESIASGGGGRD